MNHPPVRLGIIGLGGFAGAHHQAAHALEKQGECRVICACDPFPDAFQEARERLEFPTRGIPVYTDYREMLNAHQADLELVIVPTPVPLHAPMHRACVERELACYLEKPPTLDYAELRQMLAVEAHATRQTQVGFSFIVEAERQALKARILDGDFGPVRSVRFLGLAPRATGYYTRSAWAGRLRMDGHLVLDSVIGNALAHYLHNLLFWSGQEEVFSWERVEAVEAEMYRAHAIEGMDTVFMRGECANGIVVQVAATHACAGEQHCCEWIDCERATIHHAAWEPYYVTWKDGSQETLPSPSRDLLDANLRAYFDYLRGKAARPLSRLVDTKPFVECYNLTYVAAQRINRVSPEAIVRSEAPNNQGEYVAIQGIRDACQSFLATGRFPAEQGLTWGQSGGKASVAELDRLNGVIDAMCADQ
jgi:predicted dehydrogenase